MPNRFLPFGSDTLEVPAYLAKGDGTDDPGLDAWKREHPDWFVAGTWTPAPRRRPRGTPPPASDGSEHLAMAEVAELATLGVDRLDPSTLSMSDFQRDAAEARAEAARNSVPNPASISTGKIQISQPGFGSRGAGDKEVSADSSRQTQSTSRSFAPALPRNRATIDDDGSAASQRPTLESTAEDATSEPGFVVLPSGALPLDTNGHPLRIASPVTDLGEVARSGRAAGSTYAAGLASGYEGAVPAFYGEVTADVGPGGRFDFQRSGNQITGLMFGFEHLRQYRDVSNVNVGLWLQQAGYSLEDALSLAGMYSRNFSSQPGERTSHGLTPDQERYTIIGWKMGESGLYGPANRLW